MIRRPPRSTLSSSSAASDVYKRQVYMGDGLRTIGCLASVITSSSAVSLSLLVCAVHLLSFPLGSGIPLTFFFFHAHPSTAGRPPQPPCYHRNKMKTFIALSGLAALAAALPVNPPSFSMHPAGPHKPTGAVPAGPPSGPAAGGSTAPFPFPPKNSGGFAAPTIGMEPHHHHPHGQS